MYPHHIDFMVDEIIKVTGEVVGREVVKKALEGYWKGKIAIVWGIGDIMDKAKEKGIEITEEQAEDILQNILYDHSCSSGVTWDTIDAALDHFKP